VLVAIVLNCNKIFFSKKALMIFKVEEEVEFGVWSTQMPAI